MTDKKTQSAECKAQSAENKLQSSEHEMQSVEYDTQSDEELCTLRSAFCAYDDLVRSILWLERSLETLPPIVSPMGIESPEKTEWYSLLRKKLVPQLAKRSHLVVAVTGGTNTGKSVIFNLLAGEKASATDAFAAGTKHPVCLLPSGASHQSAVPSESVQHLRADAEGEELNTENEKPAAEKNKLKPENNKQKTGDWGLKPEDHTGDWGLEPDAYINALLHQYFGTFEHQRWQNANDPLNAAPQNRLYWNIGKNVPKRLLLVDTPDVDSDVEVNWDRARDVRQVADLLIAVLTAQKYNDAAVKQYFREAAEADKPVILVWNMAYHEQYRNVWSEWNKQFCQETGVKPLAVFASPHDKIAAEEQTLAIYDISGVRRQASGIRRQASGVSESVTSSSQEWNVNSDACGLMPDASAQNNNDELKISLRDYLNTIKFNDLKMQALFGAIKRVDAKESGVGAYLDQIENAARDFARAAETIRERENLAVEWTQIPKIMLADEIGRWCNAKRPELLQNVNAAYDVALRPIQWAWGNLRSRWFSKQQKAEQKEERAAVISLVEKTIEQLKSLAASSPNLILKKELNDYLGTRRRQLLETAERIHSQIPQKTDEYLRREITGILNRWAEENPDQWKFLHKLDLAAFGTHAVLTAGALATCGIIGVTAAVSANLTVAAFLAAGGITGGSETLLKILGEEIRLKIAEIKVEIQKKYADWRRGLFLERFESELWGEMLEKFDRHASASHSREFLDATEALASVRKIIVNAECVMRNA